MFDVQRFDDWVAVHDNDAEASELVRVVEQALILSDALLGHEVTQAIGREVVQAGLTSAYGSFEDSEALEYLEDGDPISAVQVLFQEVDLLNFEFARKANALKCYAMTGMIEGEDPSVTFEEKKHLLSELLQWGGFILNVVPEEQQPLKLFRPIVRAADARFALDLNHSVDVGAFAELVALFRDSSPDQIRKTLQNQISAKNLAVDERRRITASSALQFLKGTVGFPSIWMIPEEEPAEEEKVGEPIFIPVCPATFSGKDTAFVPSQRHSDGYHVGSGASARVIEGYWEALQWLSRSPEPAFQPLGHNTPIRCKADWERVDRRLLENELAAVTSVDSPERLSITEQSHRRLIANPAIQAHPVGHTSKVYRYRTKAGVELALEKRIGEPWLYVRESDVSAEVGGEWTAVPATRTGRNSNLNALPTFVGQPVRKYRLASPSDLDPVVNALVS